MTKKGPSLGERIETVRISRHENQKEFGESLGVSQGTVSAWERDDHERRPSAEMLLKISGLCKDSADTIWFLEKAGLTREVIVAAAAGISKERTRAAGEGELIYVPGEQEAANRRAGMWLPAKLVPNPDLSSLVVIDERSAGSVLKAGDVIVMERNLVDPVLLGPWRDQLIVVELGVYSFVDKAGEAFPSDSPSKPIAIAFVHFGPGDYLRRSSEPPLHWSWKLLPIAAESREVLDGYTLAFEHPDLAVEHPGLFAGDRPKDIRRQKAASRKIEETALRRGHLHSSRILGRFVGWFRPPSK